MSKPERWKDVRYNSKGYPYVPARLVEANWAWYIEYYVHSHEKGDLVRKRKRSIRGANDTEKRATARKIIKDLNVLLADGYMVGTGPKKKRDSYTVGQAMRMAVEIKCASVGKRTQQRYKTMLNIWNDWAGSDVNKKLITELDTADIISFLDYMKQERQVANYTRNNYLQDVKSCISELMERKIVIENVARGIKKLQVKGQRIVVFSKEQQAQLEAWLKMHDIRLYYFTRFIYHGFLRPVEIIRLKRKHIDLDQGIILVRAHLSKNKKQMPVTITQGLAPILEEMKVEGMHPEMHIFSTSLKPGFLQIYRNRVSERHAKAMKACDMFGSDLNMYSWKHTGNCNAYRSGVDIKALQAQNRHSSLEMTDIYLQTMGLRMQWKLKDAQW